MVDRGNVPLGATISATRNGHSESRPGDIARRVPPAVASLRRNKRPGDRAVDVALLGGGIVGTAAALQLARGGASVALFEATAIGAGASGRNSGAVQHPFDAVLAPLHETTVERYRQLAIEAPDSFAFPKSPAGLLLVAAESDLPALEAEKAAIEGVAPELHAELLTPAEVTALEPSVAPDVAAVRLETGYPVPPAAAVRAFAALAERQGVRMNIGETAALEWRDGRVVGARLAGGRLQAAGSVLIAAGPWSPAIVDPSGKWRPIERTWGVTVAVRLDGPPRHVLEQVGVGEINQPGTQAKPGEPHGFESTFSIITASGASVVGSTFMPHQPDPGFVGPELLARGSRFVPRLHTAGIDELRVCARPQSLDGRPLVGRIPGYANLYICAGHGPWGISTGPATAALVADLVLGRPVTIPAELDPGRFQ
jgi:glycine/D-amino acid oxidase-like deaminating enzyme